MTVRSVKIELGLIFGGMFFSTLFMVFLLFGFPFMVETRYSLPANFYISFLPFDKFSLNWALSYVVQVVAGCCCFLFGISYIAVTTSLINHCYWKMEVLLGFIKKINLTLNDDDEDALILGRELAREQLRKVVELTLGILDWQKRIRKLMRMNFLGDLSVLSIMFCLCIHVIVEETFRSMCLLIILAISFAQLFLYCWMGSRATARVNTLSDELYCTNWYLLPPSQRKDVHILLMMMGDFKPLDGIFKEVSLTTFFKVKYLRLETQPMSNEFCFVTDLGGLLLIRHFLESDEVNKLQGEWFEAEGLSIKITT
jgi:7tm Odorant receptor